MRTDLAVEKKSAHFERAPVAELLHRLVRLDTRARMSLDDLARASGLSRYQVLRIFKRSFGLPPHTYRLRMRIALVQERLREGVEPVSAASQYGFFDQSHLSRHFKRQLGVTPKEYALANSPLALGSSASGQRRCAYELS